MINPDLPGVILTGPSAAGKTAAAMALVQRFDAEIISVDSAMVYRGMDIGTAKPGAEELAQAPHRLIDLIDPEQAYSVAAFLDDVERAIGEVQAAGRMPLLTGGTMMYLRALKFGLSPLPASQPERRDKLEAQLQQHGLAALRERLEQVDPVAAQRIHPNDPQRTLRALEVFDIAGQRLSDLQQTMAPPLLNRRWLTISVEPQQRQNLRERIAVRFDLMLEAGFLDEMRRLRQRPGLTADSPSMRSVGYRQAWQYLDGDVDFDAFRQNAITATRQLAKRQLTWLRRDPDRHQVAMEADVLGQVVDRVAAWSATR
jgi:tRNA dimethylallyltransferase